jgi:hypothetical protein
VAAWDPLPSLRPLVMLSAAHETVYGGEVACAQCIPLVLVGGRLLCSLVDHLVSLDLVVAGDPTECYLYALIRNKFAVWIMGIV